MVDDFNGCVTDLVGDQELMKLCEVRVSLKDVQEIQRKLD